MGSLERYLLATLVPGRSVDQCAWLRVMNWMRRRGTPHLSLTQSIPPGAWRAFRRRHPSILENSPYSSHQALAAQFEAEDARDAIAAVRRARQP